MVALREQTVILDAGARFGRHIPSKACGVVLSVLPDLARQATALAFSQSPSPGRPGRWLSAASDLRVLGVQAHPDTGAATIRYEAPLLGSAAEDIFTQGLIPGLESGFARPSPEDTALDLIAAIFHDLHAQTTDSPRLDPVVLKTVSSMRKALNPRRGYDALRLRDLRSGDANIHLSPEACDTARKWRKATPNPRSIRIEGKLDMLWDSAGSFALLLDDTTFLPGSIGEMDRTDVGGLYRKRVTVIGQVIYRPNGKALRIEAEAIEPCLDASPVFSAVPEAVARSGRPLTMAQISGRNGLADLAGLLDDPAVDDATFNRMVQDIA